MTGVEGYVESWRLRLSSGRQHGGTAGGETRAGLRHRDGLGALAHYVSDSTVASFQPMNVNFGLIPPLGYRVKGKRNKNAELSKRALEALGELELS